MRVCPHCHLLLADSEALCSHDGTQTAPAVVPPLAAALSPKFQELVPFARGQTGTLQLATQKTSGFRGVLKVMPLDGFEGSERVRLKRELRKQTKLSHEGLPRIVDGGELEKELWLLRELVPGESLAQRIRRLGKLEVQEALLITAQVASALDDLQRNGLLHRDVKPGHVILQDGPQGMPVSKLIDAGIAARLPSGSVFDLIGTPAYISPEQVAGKLISFRSDLYALGCMLFEMLSGQPPFPGDDVKAVLEAHKSAPPPELPPDVELPPSAQALLQALLSKEPRKRPFSAQQVRRTIEPLLPPGAPLPVLQSRAPSSAGGISAPPPSSAAGRAVRARPGAPPVPPGGAGKRATGGGSNEPTEEIELEELEAAQDAPRGPATIHLLPDDIEEVDPEAVSGPSTINLAPDDIEELDATAFHAGPNTISLSPEDIEALEVAEGAVAIEQAAAAPAAEDGVPAGEAAASDGGEAKLDPAQPEPEPAGAVQVEVAHAAAEPAEPEPSPASEAAREASAPDEARAQPEPEPRSEPELEAARAAEPASEEAAKPASPQGRRAVAFDVESLFEDEVPVPVVTAKPSITDAAPTQIYRPESAAARAAAEVAAARKAPPEADPEGTVMTAKPGGRGARVPWLWAGAAAAALLIVLAIAASGDESEPPASAAAERAGSPANEAPAGEPPPPTPSAAAEPEAEEAQPSAAQHAAVAQAAADEAPQGEVAEGEAAPNAEPSHGEGESEPEANEPEPEQNAVADSKAAKGATLSAAEASAKLGPSAGSKLVAPRASRAERLARAEEFKQQGRAHYRAKRFREAAAAYQNATEQDPQDAGAFAGLAASRLAYGDANGAIAAYSRAVRLQPTSSGFHAALGRAYLANNDRGRARAAYEKALELNPENGAAKTALAQLK